MAGMPKHAGFSNMAVIKTGPGQDIWAGLNRKPVILNELDRFRRRPSSDLVSFQAGKYFKKHVLLVRKQKGQAIKILTGFACRLVFIPEMQEAHLAGPVF